MLGIVNAIIGTMHVVNILKIIIKSQESSDIINDAVYCKNKSAVKKLNICHKVNVQSPGGLTSETKCSSQAIF